MDLSITLLRGVCDSAARELVVELPRQGPKYNLLGH